MNPEMRKVIQSPMSDALKYILKLDQRPFEDIPKSLLWCDPDTGSCEFDFEAVVEGDQIAEEDWEDYKEKCLVDKVYPTGKFQSIYINEKGTRIILRTGNGGGNRQFYRYVFDLLRRHPQYITDYQDLVDETTVYFEFGIPAQYKEVCRDFQNLTAGEFLDKYEVTE